MFDEEGVALLATLLSSLFCIGQDTYVDKRIDVCLLVRALMQGLE